MQPCRAAREVHRTKNLKQIGPRALPGPRGGRGAPSGGEGRPPVVFAVARAQLRTLPHQVASREQQVDVALGATNSPIHCWTLIIS